ncbi:MAG: hypothetical protein K8I82_02605 [Anaerolineae bacterium]|nr:hypothetical protein [Anaerolineae bacterium]
MRNFYFTLSKRHLGLLSIAGGLVALIGIFLFDELGLSDPQGGFGPSQKIGVALAVLVVFIGITLLPLGDTPA